jgi:hypothetical protein
MERREVLDKMVQHTTYLWREERTGQDRTGQDRTGQDRTVQCTAVLSHLYLTTRPGSVKVISLHWL